jgi:hypothetical protein
VAPKMRDKEFKEIKIQNKKLIPLALAAVSTVPMYLAIFKPVTVPFADDWLIIEWNLEGQKIDFKTLTEPMNGHQVITSKLILKTLGFISPGNLQLISIASIIIGFIGMALLLTSQYKNLQASKILVLTCVLVVANLKQMQNFFTPISAQWMFAIFFIGVYYWFKQLKKNIFRHTVISLSSFLGAMTTGLGLILPIIEIVENLLVKTSKKFTKEEKKYSNSSLVINSLILSFFLFSVALNDKDTSGKKTGLGVDSFSQILLHPLEGASFIFTIIGNVFVPASRYDSILPSFVGGFFVASIFTMLLLNRKKIEIRHIFMNKNCLLGGMVYLLLLLLLRFENPSNSLLSQNLTVAAPRYTSGSVIFLLGVTVLVSKYSHGRKISNLVYIAVIFMVLFSGFKTGLEWHSKRFSQTQDIRNCLLTQRLADQSSLDPCYKLVLNESLVPDEEFLQKRFMSFFRK